MKMHIKVVPPCIQMTLLMIVRTVRRLFPVFPQNIDDSPNKETSKIREPFHIYIRYVFSFNVNKYMYRVVHFFFKILRKNINFSCLIVLSLIYSYNSHSLNWTNTVVNESFLFPTIIHTIQSC